MLDKRRKLILLSISYILVCTGYIYNLYAQSKSIIDENINNKLYFGALATAAILGEGYHDNVVDKNSKTEQEDLDAIHRLTEYNKRVGLTFIYTVIKSQDKIILTSSSASEEELQKQNFVRFFDPYPDASKALSDSFNDTGPSWVDYTDHWGDFRAVFVPLRSRNGSPYVAGAEISLREYNQRLKGEALNHAGIAILTFSAFSFLVALYLFRMRYHLYQTLENEVELHKAKTAAEIAARAKGDFLATMSHEIRTPLNGIIGATDLMLMGKLSSAQRKYAEIVSSCGESLLALINNILDFSKIEAERFELNNGVFLLRPLIESILETLKPNIKNGNVSLSCEFLPGVPQYFSGDHQRLRQVLINLIGNAIKFTEEGEVTVLIDVVSESESERVLRFVIRDTGIGISAESQQRLFQPFTQVDTSSTRRFGGTGLGLAISQRLIMLMGGEIGVSGERERGTEFFFTLKNPKELMLPEPVLDLSCDEQSIGLTSGDKQKILLAEDNPVNQQITKRMLQTLGYYPVVVENGQEAIAMCRDDTIEIILMDIQMPIMDGLEATRQLRELDLDCQPYIIAFTANAFNEELTKCYAVGMNDHLTKPATLDALSKSLTKAMAAIANQSISG